MDRCGERVSESSKCAEIRALTQALAHSITGKVGKANKPLGMWIDLGFALGLAKARDAIPFLPLTPFLEQFDPLKTLHHVALGAGGGRSPKAAML